MYESLLVADNVYINYSLRLFTDNVSS